MRAAAEKKTGKKSTGKSGAEKIVRRYDETPDSVRAEVLMLLSGIALKHIALFVWGKKIPSWRLAVFRVVVSYIFIPQLLL